MNGDRRLWGVLTCRILDLLEQYGPMTRSEVCMSLGISRNTGASVFSRLLRPVIRPEPGPRRIHIHSYRDEEEGQRRYMRAVYAIGDKPDARKPRPNKKIIAKRYRENLKLRQMNNVFALGARPCAQRD